MSPIPENIPLRMERRSVKRLLIGLLAATGLATAAFAQPASQPAPAPAAASAARVDVDPALWVVRDADTTIYLFGTFHALDGSRDWFNDEVRAAFDRSQELVLEVVAPEDPAQAQAQMAPLVARLAVDPQGRAITSRLTPQQVATLRAQIGPAVDMVDQARFEPWFVSLALVQATAQRLGLTGEHGPERVLTQAANGRQMPVSALETAEFQLGIFDQVPDADQMEGLAEILANPNRMQETLQPMLAAWSSGDVEGLATILNETVRDDPAAYRLLFTDRNATWARWIRERMARPGTVFMAVGAGHLGGPGSVQEQLQGMNVQTARVPAAG